MNQSSNREDATNTRLTINQSNDLSPGDHFRLDLDPVRLGTGSHTSIMWCWSLHSVGLGIWMAVCWLSFVFFLIVKLNLSIYINKARNIMIVKKAQNSLFV